MCVYVCVYVCVYTYILPTKITLLFSRLCIFFSEQKNMNNVNIITQVRISTRDHVV